MADLRTDYKDQLLDTSVNAERRYNLVDSDGNVVQSGVSLRDVTVYSQEGDSFGAGVLNGITGAINDLNDSLSTVNNNLSNINVSVNSGGKLVFTDKDGADTVLNFSSTPTYFSYAGNGNTTTIPAGSGKKFLVFWFYPDRISAERITPSSASNGIYYNVESAYGGYARSFIYEVKNETQTSTVSSQSNHEYAVVWKL